jgi:hypothetical protein
MAKAVRVAHLPSPSPVLRGVSCRGGRFSPQRRCSNPRAQLLCRQDLAPVAPNQAAEEEESKTRQTATGSRQASSQTSGKLIAAEQDARK